MKSQTFGPHKYVAVKEKGWLKVFCGGGTAFCIKALSDKAANKLLKPLLSLDEYGIIRHCNSHGWHFYEYVFGNNPRPGYKYAINCYDKNGKFIETVS